MTLKLIQRGAELVKLTPEIGTGWKPATHDGLDAATDTRPELMTVTAQNCDGLRIYDFDQPGSPYWETTGGANHTLTVVKQVRRGAVRVLNPTSETKVSISKIPLSLSLSLSLS